MRKLLQTATLLLLGAAVGVGEQAAKGGGKDAAAPAFRPSLPKGTGLPGGIPKAGPKSPPLRNPGSDAARLYRAAPEDRERVLEKLPIRQQERMRRELEWFDGLPTAQQTIILRRSEALASLPPDKQRAVMQLLQAINRLPPERTRAVRQAFLRLESLSDDQRMDLLAREQFRSRFSAEELQIISDLTAAMLPPRSKPE